MFAGGGGPGREADEENPFAAPTAPLGPNGPGGWRRRIVPYIPSSVIVPLILWFLPIFVLIILGVVRMIYRALRT